jgi:acetyl-CoA carboxylase carboxyltransferase component
MSELGVVKSAASPRSPRRTACRASTSSSRAGADLPNQSKIFVPGGRGFRDLTRRSEARSVLPTVCLVFGSSTAGGAYIPGMSDYTVMVKEQAQVYLGRAAAREDGHRRGHRPRGARRRRDALARLGRVGLPRRGRARRDPPRPRDRRAPQLAKAGPAAAPAVEPPRTTTPRSSWASRRRSVRVPFDAREVIARLVDGSRFSEFKPLYGPRSCAAGRTVPATRSASWPTTASSSRMSANKGAQFIQLCNQSDVPLCSSRTSRASWSARSTRRRASSRHGAKLINAVSQQHRARDHDHDRRELRRRKLRDGGPRVRAALLFSWPNHRIAVMGGKQLAGVLDIIKREAAEEGRDRRRDELSGCSSR